MHNVLDIGCGFGSFGAHLLSLKLMPLCVAAYESSSSQVQLALERGLPSVIGNFIANQLPFPSLSYDMVHCAQCGIIWDKKGIAFIASKITFLMKLASMSLITIINLFAFYLILFYFFLL